MRCPVKYLIVSIEKKFNDTVTFKSGQTLFVDTSWNPEEYAMMEATVVGIPGSTGYDPMDFKTWDSLGYSIDMEPGDKILMSYAVVYGYKDQPDRDTPIYKNLFMHEGKEYWKCPLAQVFAYIRHGVTHMVNGWVMGDIMEEKPFVSSIIITPDNHATVKYKDRMKIRHIGPNLPHEPRLKAKKGDIVYLDQRYVAEYKVNEDAFYIVRQSRILAYE